LYLQRLGLKDVRETLENLPVSSRKAKVIAFDKKPDAGKSGGGNEKAV